MAFAWTTKEGRKLRLNEIDNFHLNNIYKMLEKIKKRGYVVSYVGDIWGWDCDMDYEEEPWNEKQERTLKIIRKEINKRKGGKKDE